MGKISYKMSLRSGFDAFSKNSLKLVEYGLSRNTDQVKGFKMFFSEILSMVSLLGLNTPDCSEVVAGSDRKLFVVFSGDDGFSKRYDNILFNQVLSGASNLVGGFDVVCIGRNAYRFFSERGINIVGYMDSLSCDNMDSLKGIVDSMKLNIVSRSFSQIKLYFSANNERYGLKLYPLDINDVSTYLKLFDMNQFSGMLLGLDKFSVGNEILQSVYAQICHYILYGALLKNNQMELSLRKSLFTYVPRKARFEKIYLSLLSQRQSLLHQKVLELMTSETKMEKCAMR